MSEEARRLVDALWQKAYTQHDATREADALLAFIERIRDGERKRMLMSRNICPEQGDVVCGDCFGAGVKLYGSTTRWRGGIGGQTMTTDVCDKCWGSGKSNEPWPSHRRIAELERERDEAQTKNIRLRAFAARYQHVAENPEYPYSKAELRQSLEQACSALYQISNDLVTADAARNHETQSPPGGVRQLG